ncbi:3-dehydroquinate synthase [bacterium BMS3Abin14]|nr:3-dehydroquinate synthase [bacterium BMS3Abin14]
MRMNGVIDVRLGSRAYPIRVEPGAWNLLPEFLGARTTGSRVIVVTDERVGSHYLDRLNKALGHTSYGIDIHTIPEGEGSKSFSEVERLCRRMASLGLERGDLVIAMGGGVVGDLAGLAASLYLRGVGLVQLPTSLLAMVDSSVGGKTGINIREGKNLVGTFHQPEAVFIDTRVLGTLDDRDWFSGMAEVLKTALALDRQLFDYLEGYSDLGPLGGVDVVRVITVSCLRKAEVVEEDERESGTRRVLNFGHTLAHALEASSGYGTFRHGEAVALGMRGAIMLSGEMCGLAMTEMRRALAMVDRIPVPGTVNLRGLSGFMSRDKKSIGGKIMTVLISEIGQAQVVPLEDAGILVDTLSRMGIGD